MDYLRILIIGIAGSIKAAVKQLQQDISEKLWDYRNHPYENGYVPVDGTYSSFFARIIVMFDLDKIGSINNVLSIVGKVIAVLAFVLMNGQMLQSLAEWWIDKSNPFITDHPPTMVIVFFMPIILACGYIIRLVCILFQVSSTDITSPFDLFVRCFREQAKYLAFLLRWSPVIIVSMIVSLLIGSLANMLWVVFGVFGTLIPAIFGTGWLLDRASPKWLETELVHADFSKEDKDLHK